MWKTHHKCMFKKAMCFLIIAVATLISDREHFGVIITSIHFLNVMHQPSSNIKHLQPWNGNEPYFLHKIRIKGIQRHEKGCLFGHNDPMRSVKKTVKHHEHFTITRSLQSRHYFLYKNHYAYSPKIIKSQNLTSKIASLVLQAMKLHGLQWLTKFTLFILYLVHAHVSICVWASIDLYLSISSCFYIHIMLSIYL